MSKNKIEITKKEYRELQEIEDWINDSRNYTIHIKNNETKYLYIINGKKHYVYRTKIKKGK